MAKPIRATPTLNYEESKDFLEKMAQVERRRQPNKVEKFFIDLI
mgnify:CR=1 FL=1